MVGVSVTVGVMVGVWVGVTGVVVGVAVAVGVLVAKSCRPPPPRLPVAHKTISTSPATISTAAMMVTAVLLERCFLR